MQPPARPIAFVLSATDHGSMIVNRNDYRLVEENRGYGVGYQLLETSRFDLDEVRFVLALLHKRKQSAGAGMVALDCGANIGVHTIEWAKHMHGWGEVIAFEAQEMVYYALAGNIALNNCFNARAIHAALGRTEGSMAIPKPNYHKPASFGSLELRQHAQTEFIGQSISYAAADCSPVPLKSIDGLALPRIDFMKIDVEGMEIDVLEGAKDSIARCKPIVVLEVIKSDAAQLRAFLQQQGYQTYAMGINLLALHASDPVQDAVSLQGQNITLRV